MKKNTFLCKISVDFLEANDALTAFIDNSRLTPDEFVELVREDSREWLMGAFVWGTTPEGQDYWFNLHQQWLKICDAI